MRRDTISEADRTEGYGVSVHSNFERVSTARTLDDLSRASEQIRRRTAERDGLLARLHAEGHSIAELARAAGMSVGKAHQVARSELRVVRTIGYEGRDLDTFIEDITRNRVEVVVDVRELPLSRRRGFSKTALRSALADRGVQYLHLVGLGNPKANREPFRAGEPKAIRVFEDRLRSAGADDLETLRETINDRRAALLCVERDHRTCHRSAITQALQQADPALHVLNI